MPDAQDTRETPVELSERSLAILNRYKEARGYGFTEVEARLFADSEIDVGELRRLVRLGCPPLVGARILL